MPFTPSTSSDDNFFVQDLSAYDNFKQCFPDELFEYIALQTNQYSVLTSGSSINANSFEIEQLIGILLFSSVIKAPSYRDYWSPKSIVPCIANVMGVSRFEKIKQFFHMCDNTNMKCRGENGYDPLFKVRRVYDEVRNRCRKLPVSEQESIDEQMIPFKGRHHNKQYIPQKPHPWGFKMISRSSSDGLIHDFLLYAGPDTEMIDPLPNVSTVSNAVRTLCLTIPQDCRNIKLFMDNFYMTFDLMKQLRSEMSIQCTGTMRNNRLHGAHSILQTEKDMKKEGRGAVDQVVDCNSGITVVRWCDKRCVTMASTWLHKDPIDSCRRYDKKNKEFVNVQRPNIVKEYNQHMGGLDLSDMLMSLYKISRKSRKYYMRILYYLLGVATVN